MSEWKRVRHRDEVSLSEDGKSLEVLIGTSAWGNEYIEIPVEFVREVLDASKVK